MNIATESPAARNRNSASQTIRDLNGILLIDKPLGLTSHDVLQALRRILGIKKLGHTGTLDPLATGLLVFCVGTASKLARFLVSKDKTYEAEIRLGLSSESYDGECVSDNLEHKTIPKVGLDEIERVIKLFTGNIRQRAPKYSAIKVDGKALYKSARRGEPCDPPVRSVVIHSIEIRNYQPPFLRLTVACGKGTYIRSLAHDIGTELGVGAYLSALRRTSVGKLKLDSAFSLDDVQRHADQNSLAPALLKTENVIDLPALVVDENFAERVRHGTLPNRGDINRIQGTFRAGKQVLLKDNSGRILAIGICEIGSEELATWQGGAFYRYERVI